jgi:glc operon protein GlcG
MKANLRSVTAAVVITLAASGATMAGDASGASSAAALFARGGSFAIGPVRVSATRMTASDTDAKRSIATASATAENFTGQPTLTLEGAKRAAAAAVAYARSHGAPGGSIAVVDAGGHTLYLERLDGTFAAAADVSIGKARTAVHFGKSTRGLEEAINKGRTALVPVAGVTWFTPLQGGLPIVVDGRVIGGVGVSGALSQQQDEEIAMAGVQVVAGAR